MTIPAHHPSTSPASALPDSPPLPPSLPSTGSHRVHLAGEAIDLLAARAAWWPRTRTLLVADLHLGKAESLARDGAPLGAGVATGGVLDESLDRLVALVNALNAERVIVLGDLLHAPAGITEALVARVARRREHIAADLVVVPGNHDRRIAELATPWRLTLAHTHDALPPMGFVHDPDDPAVTSSRTAHADGPLADALRVHAWCAGHLHPSLVLGRRGDRLKLPCFWIRRRPIPVLILPAFSTFTGGSPIAPAPDDTVAVIADDAVIPIQSGPRD